MLGKAHSTWNIFNHLLACGIKKNIDNILCVTDTIDLLSKSDDSTSGELAAAGAARTAPGRRAGSRRRRPPAPRRRPARRSWTPAQYNPL